MAADPTPAVDPESTPRGRRMLRARRELATVAVRLFAEHGFGETTVEDISEAADYSASTFFRHFETKEDAVFYDIADRIRIYDPLLEDDLTPAALWDRARALLLENATYWEESDPEFALARTRLFLKEPALYRRYLMYCDDIERIVATAFAKADGEDVNTDVASFVIAAAVVGAWRAGFAKWVTTGGHLRDHIGEGLALVEPLIQR